MNTGEDNVLGRRIRAVREDRGIKPGDFANMIGKTRRSAERIQAGSLKPGLETLIVIAKVLNITLDQLLKDDSDLDELLKDDSDEKPRSAAAAR